MALQDGTTDGKIKIPYFTIKYAEVSRQSAEDGAAIQARSLIICIHRY